MPFQRVFSALFRRDANIRALIVADWDGESVDQWAAQGEMEEARIFGAHLGILLRYGRRLADAAAAGEVQELTIRSESALWFVFPLSSEYYLAAEVCPRAQSGQTAALLRRYRQRLCAEIDSDAS
ncbi:MAG: roadblock/LC7 domain-containing protein [Desulfuromonadaceae bacterium]|nr:roadblock/LC7 domain-containing protein [Desulfuromonadaceae bacterium]